MFAEKMKNFLEKAHAEAVDSGDFNVYAAAISTQLVAFAATVEHSFGVVLKRVSALEGGGVAAAEGVPASSPAVGAAPQQNGTASPAAANGDGSYTTPEEFQKKLETLQTHLQQGGGPLAPGAFSVAGAPAAAPPPQPQPAVVGTGVSPALDADMQSWQAQRPPQLKGLIRVGGEDRHPLSLQETIAEEIMDMKMDGRIDMSRYVQAG